MLKLTAKISVFVSVLLVSNQAVAVLVAGLYDVDILVADESVAVRNLAFVQGLDEVFVRISGDSIVMDKLKRPPASRYIKQFSYEPLPVSTANVTMNEQGETLTRRLKIQYNGSLMEKYLLDNGFPIWDKYRPEVIVWLAVRDGRNQYVLKERDNSLLKTTASEAMVRRGVPDSWPLFDAKDRSILSVADIRGGFSEPVINASKRYATDTALTASLIWNGVRWQSSWSLFVDGESRHWNLEDTDYKQLIKKAIDQAADILGAVFAVHNAANNQQVMSIQMAIEAVNSIEKYRYVENYLNGLSTVAHVKPYRVDGQNAVFEVLLRSNEEDFHHLIKSDAELIEIKAPQASPMQVRPQVLPDNEAGNHEEKASADNALTEQMETEKTPAEKTGAAVPLKQLPVYYYRLKQR
jgi:hypothetical protein